MPLWSCGHTSDIKVTESHADTFVWSILEGVGSWAFQGFYPLSIETVGLDPPAQGPAFRKQHAIS